MCYIIVQLKENIGSLLLYNYILVEGLARLAGPFGPLGVFSSLIVYRHQQCYYSFSFCSTGKIRDWFLNKNCLNLKSLKLKICLCMYDANSACPLKRLTNPHSLGGSSVK